MTREGRKQGTERILALGSSFTSFDLLANLFLSFPLIHEKARRGSHGKGKRERRRRCTAVEEEAR